MSRGLGPVQRRALEVIGAANGVTVPDLAVILGLAPRKARAVVQSLAERQAVRVVVEGGRRRVWDPARHDDAMAEARIREYRELIGRQARLALTGEACPTCGRTIAPRPGVNYGALAQ